MSSGTAYFDTERARTCARDQCHQVAERPLASVAGVRAREGQAALPSSLLDRQPPASADHAIFLEWTTAPTSQAIELEARVAAHDTNRGERDLVDQFRSLAGSGPVATPRRMTAPAGKPAAERPIRTDDEATAELLTQKIVDALRRVDAGASDEQRQGVTQLAKQLVETPHESWGTLLTDPRVCVQQVNQAVAERRTELAQARVIRGSLEGLDGNAVADGRSLLDEVAQGRCSLTAVDVERIEAVRHHAVADQDRRFCRKALSVVIPLDDPIVDDDSRAPASPEPLPAGHWDNVSVALVRGLGG